MNINRQNVDKALQRYQSGSLPPGKCEHIKLTSENVADHYESLRDLVRTDDNGPLDADPRDGFVDYKDGDYQNYNFSYSGDQMTKSIEHPGYAAVEEFTFTEHGIKVVEASHDCVSTGGAKGSLTVDHVARDGMSLTREKWWVDVDPLWTDLMVPNFKLS
jgi:hypothetical protein